MTHDELLAEIETGHEFLGITYAPDSHTFALRAVVELHKPHDITLPNGDWGRDCIVCHGFTYPCPTIQAIEKELK